MCYVISSESRKEAGKINSRENFIRLVNQYQNLVFSICLKHTGDYFVAEDLAQETFLSAYAHMEDFDGEQEKAWICRIASNKAIDYLRQAARKSIPTAEEDMPEEATATENEPLQTYLNKEVLEEVEKKCNALSEPYKTIAVQHFLLGKKANEIADLQGQNLKTIQTQIYRAREMLRKTIRKEDLTA